MRYPGLWQTPQNTLEPGVASNNDRLTGCRWGRFSVCDTILGKMSIGATETTTQTIPLVKHESGVIRVSRTRVSLDSVLYAFLDGSTPEEIVQQYPSLGLADVYTIIAYYLQNQAELDEYLANRRARREELHRDLETRHDLIGIRDKLLARRTRS